MRFVIAFLFLFSVGLTSPAWGDSHQEEGSMQKGSGVQKGSDVQKKPIYEYEKEALVDMKATKEEMDAAGKEALDSMKQNKEEADIVIIENLKNMYEDVEGEEEFKKRIKSGNFEEGINKDSVESLKKK